MTPRLFGIEELDPLSNGSEPRAYLSVGQLREDGAIDVVLLTDAGTLRYVATMNARDRTGIVDAPEPFNHLARFTHDVLETNVPIVRRPSTVDPGWLLSVLPVLGRQKRVVYLLEPDLTAEPDASP